MAVQEVGMAVMRPPLGELDRLEPRLNDGERHVAGCLSRLDDSWTVYVQPRLGQDVPDFVAVHDRYGVCAIEVKDWAYGKYRQTDSGKIQFNDGAGHWCDSDQLPRYQAYRYRSTIFDQYFALPDDGAAPPQTVRAALVLPDYSTEHAQRLFAKQQVSPKEESVRIWGGDGLEGSVLDIVKGAGCPPPSPASMDRLRRQLVESGIVSELRSPVGLSADARNIATNPSNARRRRVRGPAGCGKSFGLAARAARLAAEGRTVLALTFNTTLANYVRTLVNARCRELAAVLVDEGQDFTLEWWNLLRHHVVEPDGEMLLVADPTQDVYDKHAWTDEERMLGAGFSGPWTELKGSYRMPTDIVPLANEFAAKYLDGERLAGEVPDDHRELFGDAVATRRRWQNVRSSDLGAALGHEVVHLLTTHLGLAPNDVAFLCEHHRDGLAAVEVIEAAGFPVHHIFAKRDEDQSRRKGRFWPDAPGVKGCTVHSFKGWETPALVMGIGAVSSLAASPTWR